MNARIVFDWLKTVTNKVVASMFKRYVPFKGLKAHCRRTKTKGGGQWREKEKRKIIEPRLMTSVINVPIENTEVILEG